MTRFYITAVSDIRPGDELLAAYDAAKLTDS